MKKNKNLKNRFNSEELMKLKKPSVIIFIALFLGLFISVNSAQTTETKSHEIGILWETMFASGSIPNYAPLQNQMTYPGGDFRTMTRKNLSGLGIWIGMTEWTDSAGQVSGEAAPCYGFVRSARLIRLEFHHLEPEPAATGQLQAGSGA